MASRDFTELVGEISRLSEDPALRARLLDLLRRYAGARMTVDMRVLNRAYRDQRITAMRGAGMSDPDIIRALSRRFRVCRRTAARWVRACR